MGKLGEVDYSHLLGTLANHRRPTSAEMYQQIQAQAQAQINADLAQVQQDMAQAVGMNSLLGAQMQVHSPRMPTDRDKISLLSAKAREHFVQRMGGVRGNFDVQAGDCIYTHVLEDRCILFYCLKGKTGIVEEPTDVFPSDTLIAQFRMILV